MTVRKTKKKTVAFYEIVDVDGHRLPGALPWDEVIGDLTTQSVGRRRHNIFSIPHWGKSYTYAQQNHFILAKYREEGVSSLDVTTDEVIDGENDVKRPWVEVSISSFIRGTNIFGYVLGSQAAPRPSSMVAWINEHAIFDAELNVRPVVSQNVMARLNGADEAALLRVHLTRDQAWATRNSDGLYSAAQSLSESFGDVELELVVRVAGKLKRSQSEERRSILDSARRFSNSDVKNALVELINYDPSGRPERNKINLLEDRLAKKMDVSVTDDEGNPIRLQSAVNAIMQASSDLRQELLEL
ncbi:hypothetical protein [Actinomadura flavalba]|uniref:hypothetical protein n=1 Tax=Actinomadura flavalba TaxID=1120938 RepID=UPI0012DEA5FB|nr:hypothetical protein [Actinomadura flavalba]